MKNKILDLLGFGIIIYGLAMFFVLLSIVIFESNVFVLTTNNLYSIYTLIIRPVPFAIAIWLSIIIMGRKQAYKQAHTLYDIEIDSLDKKIVDKDKQIANYIILDNVRIEKARKLEKEISEIKVELSNVAKGEIKPIVKKKPIKISDKIPFHNDINLVEETWICPECERAMTRQTDKIIFCDNPSCHRRQWKKSEL